MNLLVCVKQIVEPDKIEYDSKTKTIMRNPAYLINNPADLNALEFALKIKDKINDAKITTLSMGALDCKNKIKELIELGADECYLLSDKRLSGSDASATSYALANAIRAMGRFDLILCGEYSLDGETSIVPPQIAEYLGMLHISSVVDMDISDNILKIKKKIEQGFVVFEAKTPILMSVVKDSNKIRFPKLSFMLRAFQYEPNILTLEDLNSIDDRKIGLSGSKTAVEDFEEKLIISSCEIIEDDNEQKLDCIVETVLQNI